MKNTLLLVIAAVPLVTPARLGAYQAKPAVFLKGDEVYVRMAGAADARQVTDDGLRKGLLVQSSSGKRLAFVRESKTELADIMVIGVNGSVQKEIRFRPVGSDIQGMRGVERLNWISDRRLVAAGSINPSTGDYAVIDVETGEQVAGYLVEGDAWEASPDGEHAAYVGFIPHFTPKEDRRPQLCLDDECRDSQSGYPKNDVHLEFMTNPVWSPDSTAVAIVAEKYGTDLERVIIRRVGGKTLDLPVPDGAEGSLGVAWDGDTLILSSSKGKWRFNPGTPSFDPIQQAAK